MPCAVDAALQDCPHTFNAIRRYRAACVFAAKVVDCVVLEEDAVQSRIGCGFIGHERGPQLHIVVNRVLQGFLVRVLNRHCDSLAATLTETHDSLLSNCSTAHLQFLGFVLVAIFAANKALINLNNAAQLARCAAASLTQPLKHKPCRLLSNSDLFSKLHRTDALTGRDHQVHGINPLVQGNMRPLKDGSCPHGVVNLAFVATVEAALAGCDPVLAAACRTDCTVRPKTRFKVDASGFRVWDQCEEFKSAYRALAHEPIVLNSLEGFKYYFSVYAIMFAII